MPNLQLVEHFLVGESKSADSQVHQSTYTHTACMLYI